MRLGQSVRLASVRCLTLPSWRKDSRRRMQAGEFRLGTVSMYMSTNMPIIAVQINKKSIIYMATFSSLKSPDLSIEAIQRTIVRSNFRLAISLRIKYPDLLRYKKSVFSYQLAVEIDFAASVFRPLDTDQIPMNLASV